MVIAVFDTQVDDFAGGSGVGKIEGGGAVEFDILSGDADTAGKKVSFHIENLHGEATRLGGAVVEAGVARFGAVAADNRVFGAVVEEALLEMFGEVIMDDELALDDTLGSSVGSCVYGQWEVGGGGISG